jgi:TolB protein
MTHRKFLLGAVAFFALAPQVHGQIRRARPQPQRPIEVPQAVVLLPIDTADGDSTRTIIQRDFDYGDRIQPLILDSATMADIWKPGDVAINFTPLAQTRANFLVRARPTAAGLRVEVFDPKGKPRREGIFRLPKLPANRLPAIHDSLWALRAAALRDTMHYDSIFARFASRDSVVRDSAMRERRLAIHGVSDELERWITGTRGIASTKIAFVEGKVMKIIDSDGANERILPTVGAALSPAWHPSGRWIVYVDADDRGTRIGQIDLRAMRPRLLSASKRGLNITPVYTKDGKNIVWAAGGDSPAELFLASATGDDSVPKPFVGRTGFETTSPSFSPDGKQIVFMSPVPLTPQLYTMNVNGTGLRLLTPVVAGKRSYRTGPDWSPAGDEIAFQQQNGDFQVWTIGVKDRVMRQITSEGENEDPSWAPDGRHLSITRRLGAIGDQRNIWVLDKRTGRLRQLTQSGDARLSDWSPPLKAAF